MTTVYSKLVIFSIIDNTLKIFLENNKLPQQVIVQGISLDSTVKHIFEKATSILLHDQFIEQLYTNSSENIVSIVYYILVPEIDIAQKNTDWKSYTQIESNEYSTIEYAVQRLRWKIEYTNVVYSLLPKEFSLSDLQKTYEAVFGRSLDKRNFRKKILSLNFLQTTGKQRKSAARPAQMYRFTKRKPVIIHIFS